MRLRLCSLPSANRLARILMPVLESLSGNACFRVSKLLLAPRNPQKVPHEIRTRSRQRPFCRRSSDQRLTDTIAKQQSQKRRDDLTKTSSQRALAAGDDL